MKDLVKHLNKHDKWLYWFLIANKVKLRKGKTNEIDIDTETYEMLYNKSSKGSENKWSYMLYQ